MPCVRRPRKRSALARKYISALSRNAIVRQAHAAGNLGQNGRQQSAREIICTGEKRAIEMGLALEVGMLAGMVEYQDEECAQWFNEEMARLNSFLLSFGLKEHKEPEACEVFSCSMRGYSGLHYLRRLAAHVNLRNELPGSGDDDSSDDPVLREYYRIVEKGSDDEQSKLKFDHLILHSDSEGYYLPQDFEVPLIPPESLKVAGDIVGSSLRLLRECEALAGYLKLPLSREPVSMADWSVLDQEVVDVEAEYVVEKFIWRRLYLAAKYSVQSGAAIVFC